MEIYMFGRQEEGKDREFSMSLSPLWYPWQGLHGLVSCQTVPSLPEMKIPLGSSSNSTGFWDVALSLPLVELLALGGK
jgi:hypothetical protein